MHHKRVKLTCKYMARGRGWLLKYYISWYFGSIMVYVPLFVLMYFWYIDLIQSQ